MREEQIIEVIDKLVGGIKPIGETNCDVKAKKNLEVMIELVGHYVDEICEIAQTDSYMASVQDCQKIAHDFIRGLKDAYESIEIVDELAEEHKGGWIPCSERSPNKAGEYIVMIKGAKKPTTLSHNNGIWFEFDSAFIEYDVIAWQPLPEPYHSKVD